MSSFLWLLLYLAPLLGLTAAVFAWFGWQWRGSDMQKRIDELAAQIETAQTALRQSETEHAAAIAKASTTASEVPAPQPTEAQELQALRDDLKSAHVEAQLRREEAAKASEAALALETEMARLVADLEHLRVAHASTLEELKNLRNAAPVPVPAPVETVEAPAKPKRKRTTTAKPKAASSTLREKVTVLESQLSTHQTGLATLTQDRDDWQRRITQLEGQTPADPAGMGLARRSLADSEKRLAIATAEIERLRLQTEVLRRVEQGESALLTVPDDDLTQIKGIKKIISEQLRAHGIRTWRQIAQWNEDEQRAFSELLAFKNRATREQWQQQARALHEAAHGPLP
jgi:predicted flap endonuclease-1-like 5' DNA nuclease